MYRTRSEILAAKEAKGGQSASISFLGGDVASTLVCQATPGGILLNLLRETLGKIAY